LGTLYLTGNRQTYWDDSAASSSLQAGFSSAIGKVSYNFAYGYSRYAGQPAADKTAFLSFSIPLGDLRSGNSQEEINRPFMRPTVQTGTAMDMLPIRPGSTALLWRAGISVGMFLRDTGVVTEKSVMPGLPIRELMVTPLWGTATAVIIDRCVMPCQEAQYCMKMV
jgi:hypothetical protein